jgi:Rrf2 family protein
MILRSHVEWALHCCALLASLSEHRHLSTKALAEFHGVPKEYLSKALQALSNALLVETKFGPTGGYRLSRSPSQITVLEIVEAVEGRAATFQCANIRANNPCRDPSFCETRPCPVARVMWEADAAWRSSLSKVALSDIVASVSAEAPEELYRKTGEWANTRAG